MIYDHRRIEKKWQKRWEKASLYRANDKSKKPNYYCLIEFPYPSGDGLHVGHIRSNTAMDIIARKRRMEGYNVLYPIGWDAFGLPTENYAIKTGMHPSKVTKNNTDTFREQLKNCGFSFDWSREINTTDPGYYKWTQWIFLQLLKNGLAYKKKMPINWCLSCKIGLANEEVVDGRCDRCGGETEKREKEQWMLAITKYADRLDRDLDLVDYLPKIKIQQRNWIGRSEGAIVKFKIKNKKIKITDEVSVFTTRPDTLFGATYLVVAPEHEIIKNQESRIKNYGEVEKYAKETKEKSEIDRTTEGREKTGVELKGIKAVNPANGEEVPVFVADYVLGHYGTGAIMAVPAHDERDFEFAKKYKLPIKTVIEPLDINTGPGKDAVCHGLPFVERNNVIAIVKHPDGKQVLCVRWKQVVWNGFVTGGIEDRKSPEETARAEVLEETGFTDIGSVRVLSGSVHAQFYHVVKNQNRFAHYRVVEVCLKSLAQSIRSAEEDAIHELVWLPETAVYDFLTRPDMKAAWNACRGNFGCFVGDGVLVNSGQFSGRLSSEVKKEIVEFVGGETKTTYKLRDWVFSRQRYWGEPIPVIFCKDCFKNNGKLELSNPKFQTVKIEGDGYMIVPVPEKDLPVKLPKLENYKPTDTGESPLAAVPKWVNVKCPKCGGKARRETDTMPNWAGSSWYYLAYCLGIKNLKFKIKNEGFKKFKKLFKNWLPVDWYNGGLEHTTLHLLYSRFWHKFLYDIGAVPTVEPYEKRTSHGMVLAAGGEKMSKSKGNVINPEPIIELLGADTLRIYEMFMGPFGEAIAWNTDSMAGSRRFLERVWRLQLKISAKDGSVSGGKNSNLDQLLQKTVKKVGGDIEEMKFNTAVSALMILVNEMEKFPELLIAHYQLLLKLLSPFAPHITEELWSRFGHLNVSAGAGISIHLSSWPKHKLEHDRNSKTRIVIQVNSRVRDEVEVALDMPDEVLRNLVFSRSIVKKWLGNKKEKKIIVVKNRLVNIVV